MTEHISAYIKEVNQLYQTGVTTEHSFRPALQQLLKSCTNLIAINEPTHIACGAPDFTLLTKDHLAVAYIEAKDLFDSDLEGKKKNKEQFDRYKNALDTVVFTDYLDFHLYVDGVFLDSVKLAVVQNGKIVLNEPQVGRFESLIEKLRSARPQKIASSTKLAKLMAGKARLLANAIELSLQTDTEKTGNLHIQLNAFKDTLIKDLDEKRFADIYAQTIAYGLFAARIHDTTPDHFTRVEAASLIPKTNPFLRQIFQHIATFDLDERIEWIVDDLVNIFGAVDVRKLRQAFEKEMQHRDPMIHFYEDFLKYYDPASKKKYGVYYTPQPVVEFIVRAVDDILKSEFAIPKGLADTSKVNVKVREFEKDNDVATEQIVSRHRVQVLDPATGTGTFLTEVVRRIKEQQQSGAWSSYVRDHLIPRIYGFELMMAPYTIAHLKLDMLTNFGAEPNPSSDNKGRVQIYLTNSLDQTELTNKYTFAEMIAREANEANNIKHNAPVMVMLGNPPYSVSSSNKSPWILNLLEDYKKNLNERKLNLDDDYIKFIRLGQYYIERTGEGVLAYISNNSFLDGVTHRQMRRELMRCFDDIYILDLHGNSRRNDTAPDGSKDENVFSIMQGVSINIFVKKPNSENKPASIHHYDLFGTRKEKYAFLLSNSISSISWNILHLQEPYLFFVPKDFSLQEEYNDGFRMDELMKKNVSGFQTKRDALTIHQSKDDLLKVIYDFENLDNKEIANKYSLKDGRDWTVAAAKNDVCQRKGIVKNVLYRPFDERYTYYSGRTKGFIAYPRREIYQHLINNNITLITCRQQSTFDFQHVFVSQLISDMCSISAQTKETAYIFPLYLYPSESELGFEAERKPNLDETIWRTIENWVQYGQAFKPLTANEQNGELGFDAEPEQPHTLAPEDIFDYIYGVLHSPAYRAKYKEFLKVDFPRIPYPKNAEEFEHFRNYGHQLRELHLMHNVPESPVTFLHGGSMIVEALRWEWSKDDGYSGNVWINDKQCFEGIPAVAWNLFIGGYQPAQKWLKDRKGRALSSDDVEHYRNIITVLCETDRLMQEIDKY